MPFMRDIAHDKAMVENHGSGRKLARVGEETGFHAIDSEWLHGPVWCFQPKAIESMWIICDGVPERTSGEIAGRVIKESKAGGSGQVVGLPATEVDRRTAVARTHHEFDIPAIIRDIKGCAVVFSGKNPTPGQVA